MTGTLAGTGGVFAYVRANRMAEKSTGSSIQSAEVIKSDISETIIGTGNLELADGEAVTVPSGLTVQNVFAESGDSVSKGTVLATLNQSSIQDALQEVQKNLVTIDEKLSSCQENDDENVLASPVSGRIKAIYVEEDSDVTDTMLQKGELMEISTDGLMAVEIETDTTLNPADSVSVTLSDGTAVTGTVEEIKGNSAVVTLTDEGTAYGDNVTVTDSEGNILGTGNLYIHKSFAVTGISGTVSSVSVSQNQKISSGDKLMVLEGTAGEEEYSELLEKRESETATLKKLLNLAENPQIIATADGIIEDVNIAASVDTSGSDNSESSGTVKASQMSYTKSSENMVFLSFDDGSDTVGTVSESTQDNEQKENPSEQKLSFSVAGSGTSSLSLVVVPVPVTGETPVSEINAADGTYTGVITWNPADSVFMAGTDYQALIVLTAGDGYYFGADSILGTESGTLSGIRISDDGKNLEFQIAFPATSGEEISVTPEDSSENTSSANNGNTNEPQDNNTEKNQNASASELQNSSTGTQNSASVSGSSSASVSGSSSASVSGNSSASVSGNSSASGIQQGSAGTASVAQNTSSTENTAEESDSTNITLSQYSTDVTAFTVAPSDQMCLSVSVDELDINSVETGQEAVITFDAIEDQKFTGTVTDIGNTASVSGGVAKYTVYITLEKTEQMKQGMNASATITTEKREQVLTLPMNAIQEKGDKSFVYTKKDADGNLSGETEISTGLSDGSTVEITDGLEEGATVYYQRTGNVSETNGSQMPGNMADNPGMGDMSGGPGGNGGAPGNMPDGGGGMGKPQ